MKKYDKTSFVKKYDKRSFEVTDQLNDRKYPKLDIFEIFSIFSYNYCLVSLVLF